MVDGTVFMFIHSCSSNHEEGSPDGGSQCLFYCLKATLKEGKYWWIWQEGPNMDGQNYGQTMARICSPGAGVAAGARVAGWEAVTE